MVSLQHANLQTMSLKVLRKNLPKWRVRRLGCASEGGGGSSAAACTNFEASTVPMVAVAEGVPDRDPTEPRSSELTNETLAFATAESSWW